MQKRNSNACWMQADGVTVSHLRFGPDEIKSEYCIQSDADFLSCSHPSYVYKYEMLEPLKDGGIFVLNSPWTSVEELEQRLPAKVKKDIASKNVKFYNIDATSISRQVGLGKRVNSIMQVSFDQSCYHVRIQPRFCLTIPSFWSYSAETVQYRYS